MTGGSVLRTTSSSDAFVLRKQSLGLGPAPPSLLDVLTNKRIPPCEHCVASKSTFRGCSGAVPNVTICEVRKHWEHHDCWLVVGSEVFDASSVINTHPGGSRSIARRAGGRTDCREDLEFHSSKAKAKWRGLKVGNLVPCDGEASLAHSWCPLM